ncbi:DUF1127 domain-containing protein [Roseobacter fucihabitans]|nr:DUF1127 domain-containing protein [Roseobacter litoralis]
MAYYTQINTRSESVIERTLITAANLLQAASERYARNRVFRETYAELSKLGERELNDLGMSRSMIRAIALDAAEQYAG